jgi:hypothetical protein
MSKFTIFDCDNVLSDDAWRIPLINWKQASMWARYNPYHLASAFDEVGNKPLLKGLHADQVLIFTAMPEEYRVLRQLWFHHKRIGFNKIYMRPDKNHEHSAALKRWMLYRAYEEFGIGPANIAMAYDDREDVIAMYKEEGVTAELICIHNVCAYTAPNLRSAA